LGQTNFKAEGSATIVKRSGSVSVVRANIAYTINDRFDDVPDIANWTPPNYRTGDNIEELWGGMGYQIIGQWSTGVANYPR
jgi:hypothetical protein